MRIAAPQMFWLLALVVLPLIGFLWWAWRRRQVLIAQFISARLLAQLKVGVSPSRQKARLAFIVIAVIFIITALARPQWGSTQEEVRQRGLDIIVAIDTSKSMLAEDVQPNRLARAKLAALDLVRRAKTDRMGLVAFAGTAFLQCPLTLDDAAFSQSVDSLDTRAISQGGTAIAEAIDEARNAFKKDPENHKVLVLFTDGEDQDSEAVTAAERAAKDGMIIFTIGIGTPEGELLRIRDERGRVDYIRDEQGNPVKSRLNEDLLQKIARATRGFYLPLRGGKTMDTLYDQGIAPLPKTEGTVKLFQRYTERYQWPLAIAIALLIAEMFLPDRSRRRSGRPVAVPPVIGAATGTVTILLFLALSLAARAGSPNGALREYNEGKFLDALKDYNQLIDKKSDDPRLHFNAGAAAYQGQQLDEAARQFNQALASPDLPLQQRAYYNLGNTFYRLGQQISDADKKQEAWENSVKQYDSALKLNQQDTDARFNQDFVKKQLEELKKQQQQQKQNQKNQDQKNSKDQNKNQQSQNQKDEKNQQDKQDQKNQQDKQNQKDQQQNQADQNKSGQEQKNPDQSQAGDKQKEQDKKPDQSAQNQAGDEPKDQSSEEARREAELTAAGQMTQQQARQLLDSQKDDEQVLRLAPPNKNTVQDRPFKDW